MNISQQTCNIVLGGLAGGLIVLKWIAIIFVIGYIGYLIKLYIKRKYPKK